MLDITHEHNATTVRFKEPTINHAALDALISVVREAAADDAVRALVIDASSEGDAGDDMGPLPERLVHRQPSGGHGPGPLLEQELVRALHDYTKPTIALLHGNVFGLAFDIACCCDVRLASTDAVIGDPRIRQGRAAATGISYLLPKLIGQSQAMRLLLLGELLDAAEAHRIGLVHEVAPAEEFPRRATALTETVAKLPTRAWEVHKLQVIPQLDLPFEAAMVHCLGVRQTHVIEDRIEGMQAWRERRDPEFTGR